MMFTWDHPQLFNRDGALSPSAFPGAEGHASAERFTYRWSESTPATDDVRSMRVDVERELQALGYRRVKADPQLHLRCHFVGPDSLAEAGAELPCVLEMSEPDTGDVLWQGWLVRRQASN